MEANLNEEIKHQKMVVSDAPNVKDVTQSHHNPSTHTNVLHMYTWGKKKARKLHTTN
jgi:hypothetical protein